MREQDRRLGLIIIGVLLLIPVAFAVVSFVIGFLIERFI